MRHSEIARGKGSKAFEPKARRQRRRPPLPRLQRGELATEENVAMAVVKEEVAAEPEEKIKVEHVNHRLATIRLQEQRIRICSRRASQRWPGRSQHTTSWRRKWRPLAGPTREWTREKGPEVHQHILVVGTVSPACNTNPSAARSSLAASSTERHAPPYRCTRALANKQPRRHGSWGHRPSHRRACRASGRCGSMTREGMNWG